MAHQIRVGVTLCTPMPFVRKSNGRLGLQHLTVEWYRHRMALQMGTNIQYYEVPQDGQEVGAARNAAAIRSLELESEFIFFIDSDVLIPFDGLKKLMKRAREYPDYDIFSGVYTIKDPNPEPLMYLHDGTGPYWDWAIGDLVFDLASVGMGCCLIRTELFDKLEHTEKNPWFLSTNTMVSGDDGLEKTRGTEDIHFCARAREEVGAKILVDTSILCGHQDLETGTTFGIPGDGMPLERAKWMPQHKEEKKEFKAIDLGCGGSKGARDSYKSHPEYKWYTLDIRKDTGADYVQDIRGLNFPDNHWDLVFSSHTFEHIGRFEQEMIWAEAYRVCKPGGKIEIIVPNIQWAGAHLANGNVDAHVMNVIYGAQEEHDYARDLNTHYFGYTPGVGIALAAQAGFEDVEVDHYKNDESLLYNLVIKGTKPLVEKAKKESLDEGYEEVDLESLIVDGFPDTGVKIKLANRIKDVKKKKSKPKAKTNGQTKKKSVKRKAKVAKK